LNGELRTHDGEAGLDGQVRTIGRRMTGGRAGRFLLQCYDYLVCVIGAGMFAGAFLAWSMVALPIRLLLPARTARPFGRSAIMYGFRILLSLLSLTRRFHFDLIELDALRGDTPLIIAANHPSLWDVVMIVSRLPNVACIMKVEAANNMFMGGGARLAGFITNKSTHQMVRHAIEEVKNGGPLLLFPEGTRTVRHPINRLTASIGIIAGQAQAPVQTVFIESESVFLTKRWPLLKRPILPMSYRLRLGKRFPPPTNARLFVSELERYFIDELGGQVRDGQPSQESRPAHR
jgi:1-acyl-sn-glycerol-3-phosphate acyltransferase